MAFGRAWQKSVPFLVAALLASLPCFALATDDSDQMSGDEHYIYLGLSAWGQPLCWQYYSGITGYYSDDPESAWWRSDTYRLYHGGAPTGELVYEEGNWFYGTRDIVYQRGTQKIYGAGTTNTNPQTMGGDAWVTNNDFIRSKVSQYYGPLQGGFDMAFDDNCTEGSQVPPPPPPVDDGSGDPIGPCDAPTDPRFDGNENAINYIALNGGIYEIFTWKKRTNEQLNYPGEGWVLYRMGVSTEWRMQSVRQTDGSYRTYFYNVLGSTIKALAATEQEEKGATLPWNRALDEMSERFGAARDNAADGDCTFGNNAPPDPDTDGDGDPDSTDPDDDDDGEGDDVDPCPLDAECTSENHDSDDDGEPDAQDPDDDDDGTNDPEDETPRDYEDGDCDGDGLKNRYDPDDDDDGIADAQDTRPCGRDPDCDHDGIPDVNDPDDDDDKCPDQYDPAPCNPAIHCNCDNDSKIDPFDPDDDNDDCPDESDPDPCNAAVGCKDGELVDYECPGTAEFNERLDAALDGWKELGIDLTALSSSSENGRSWAVSVPIPGVGDRTFYLGTYLDSSHWAASAVETGRMLLRSFLLVCLAVSFTNRIIRTLRAL